ncbi:MAG TPA: hypothetical protein VD948_11710 [Rhodothermales bacterium]|nr:hypothetical protein [Rhodothermales bacterium]
MHRFSLLRYGLFLGLAACDAAPGREDVSSRVPIVSALSITPNDVLFENLPAAQVVRDSVTVPIRVEADVTDPEGALRDVVMAVRRLDGALAPLVSRPMTAVGNGRYRAEVTLRLPINAGRGTYAVVVYATDETGELGEAQGRFAYNKRGNAPVVTQVSATPNPFTNPTGSAARTLTLTAVVTDTEGLSDVLRVEAIAPDSTAFRLYDDGKTSGDPTAGDGRFTAAFLVTSANPLPTGPLTFRLRATDRNNLRSADVPLTVTVQ